MTDNADPAFDIPLLQRKTLAPQGNLLRVLFRTQWRKAPLLPASSLRDNADGLLSAFMAAVLNAGPKRGTQHA